MARRFNCSILWSCTIRLLRRYRSEVDTVGSRLARTPSVFFFFSLFSPTSVANPNDFLEADSHPIVKILLGSREPFVCAYLKILANPFPHVPEGIHPPSAGHPLWILRAYKKCPY